MDLKHFVVNALISRIDDGWRLTLPPTTQSAYFDAQLDDFGHPSHLSFAHCYPSVFELDARFSHKRMCGTSGFGYWNNPFGINGEIVSPPCSIWFFNASADSDLQIKHDGLGWGFKAASLNSGTMPGRLPGGLVRVLNTLTKVALGIPPIARLAMRVAQAVVRAAEMPLAPLPGSEPEIRKSPVFDITQWHKYRIHWLRNQAQFFVDDIPVLSAESPPKTNLGLVIWLDNYRATAAHGRYEFGYVACDHEQWLEVKGIKLE